MLAQLRSLGIQIAIDDFGTGYSSLRYLRRFPVDVLKIAKPFIDGIEQENGQEWAFARLITDLATTLGLITVAEGIEMPGQHDRLVELGCAYGQGYLYGRPRRGLEDRRPCSRPTALARLSCTLRSAAAPRGDPARGVRSVSSVKSIRASQ